jgi:SfnB family sulfur acquisition oxidoreductase
VADVAVGTPGARPEVAATPDEGRPAAVADAQSAIEIARAYADSVRDTAAERDRAGQVPRAELARLDASGLLSITVPAADGGPELSPLVLAEVTRLIAAADPSLAQVPQGHFLFVDVLALWGSAPLRQRILGDALEGARIASALAERGTAHAQALTTRLIRDGDALLRLSGRKYYCTGALTARWLAVSALDDRDRQVLAFVPSDAPGVIRDEDWSAMGQRATVSGSVVFDDVRLSPEFVLPYWRAFERPQVFGARAQLVHAAIEVGIAGGALRDAGAFVRERSRPFFEAVRSGAAASAAGDPHTILRYGRLATQLAAAEALLREAARTLTRIGRQPADAGEAALGSIAVAQAKAFGSETAVLIASELFALTGTSATDERFDLDRHWRNARTHSVHDPVDWKYHHVGNWTLNGIAPPNHGQI